jgi:polyisoprenyl-teichoic acid--peptidoglycan teichoic acid transferase
MRSALAGLLGLLVPGAGHALLGRRRAALIFLAPIVVILAAALILFLQGGIFGIGAFIVTPGVLPALAVLNVAVLGWRILAGVDAAWRTDRPWPTAALMGGAILVLVLAPHLWIGSTIAATSDFLDSTFASDPASTDDPNATDAPDDTPPPIAIIGGNGPRGLIAPGQGYTAPVPTPTPKPKGPFTAGIGSLPGLNVAVPWQRPGAVPWGDDGRFDLLLLGSDAGIDRWSRRMDVMLLVEVDVATGKVAMIGLPRNLLNAPFPPGSAAYDENGCHCLQGLLNEMYVDATVNHPADWPGTGAIKGIGAVRSVVSELTGRPIDAVLVADLWGVIKVVNAMGGVDIDIPYAVTDDHYPDPVMGDDTYMTLPAGQQHLDGREALFYARSRHQDSDYGRMQRQQVLLLAIRDQIGPATILDAPALASAAKGFVWTDLPRDSLPNLVTLFGKAANASVKNFRVVPPTYPEYLTPAEITKIQHDIAAMLGVPPPPPPTPSPTPSPTPLDTAPPPTEPPTPEPSASP